MLELRDRAWPQSSRKLLPAPQPERSCGMRSEPLRVELSSPVDHQAKTCGVSMSKPVYSAPKSRNQPWRRLLARSFTAPAP